MANASETNVGPMAPRVCVVGSVNMDLTFVVDALPRPGETVLAASLTRTPGGKGANQAVAAARAGAQVQFSGAFGDDPAAAQLRAHLRANAVGLDRTVTVPGPSGTAIIVVDASAENTVLVAPGANAHLTPVPSAVANCDVLLTQLRFLLQPRWQPRGQPSRPMRLSWSTPPQPARIEAPCRTWPLSPTW